MEVLALPDADRSTGSPAAASPPTRQQAGATGVARWWIDECGWPVFGVSPRLDEDGKWIKAPGFGGQPLPDGDEAPLLDRSKGGYHQATATADNARLVVRPDSWIASPLPPWVIALDVDKPDDFAAAVEEPLGAVWSDFEARALVVATRWPDERRRYVIGRVPNLDNRVCNRSGQIIPGVDVKGGLTGAGTKDGYVMCAAPGQQRPDGKGEYRILHGDPRALADFPPGVLNHLADYAPARDPEAPPPAGLGAHGGIVLRTENMRAAAAARPPEEVVEPGRYPYLFQQACAWFDGGAVHELGLSLAEQVNARFPDPTTPAEVARAVNDAWERTRPAREERERQVRAAAEEAVRNEAPAREAARRRRAQFDPREWEDFLPAVRHVGCEIVGIQPADVPGVIFPGESDPREWEFRGEVDDRLAVALMGADNRSGHSYTLRADVRRAYVREAARLNPRTYAEKIDEARAAIVAAVRSCPSRTIVTEILKSAGVLNHYQSPAQAKVLERLAVKVLGELGWSRTPPIGVVSRSFAVWAKPRQNARRADGSAARMEAERGERPAGVPLNVTSFTHPARWEWARNDKTWRCFVPPAGWTPDLDI